ncbi:hypothetical protein E4U42_001818 [Claviceps africana]|uniref:Uncharacterized protein n=1 Tax=Claviceps africana TaxID=83212 RepID=A0A8K0J912_9HYPO|nr:hypothetical protein E4U42_001818 [Claviceps africana]
MKFFAVTIAALAGVAAAVPTDSGEWCQPGTYRCDPNYPNGKPGWDVCNTSSQWEFGGNCPPHTVCLFNTKNGSPYCVPPGFQFP